MPIYPYKMNHRLSYPQLWRKLWQQKWADRGADALAPIRTDIVPVFVVGCGHTGTTLLAAKLGNHSRVYTIERETSAFIPEQGLPKAHAQAREWVAAAEAAGKTHLVEKTPKHVHCVARIRRVFPQARFVVITRNPLDTVASLNKRHAKLQRSAERWMLDTAPTEELIRNAGALHIRYEDLTTAPEQTFQRICDFLGLFWEPGIIGAGDTVYEHTSGHANMQLRRQQVREAITPRIGTWRQSLSAEAAKQVAELTAETARALGYDPLAEIGG